MKRILAALGLAVLLLLPLLALRPSSAALVGGALLLALAAVALGYWLLVVTEGAYLGRTAVRWLYDRGATTYHAVKRFDRHDEAAALGNPLFRRLEETAGPGALVLDVASGTGRLPLALLDLPFFTGQVVGLDDAARMLAEAARLTAPWPQRCHLVHHPAVPLPFADDAFDAVTLLEALEFLPDRAAALREMVRVLRPGGWLLVSNRIGIDYWLLPGRVDRPARFEDRLRDLGLVEVRTRPWQTYYDLVWGRRPGRAPARHGPLRWYDALRCPTCRADGRWRVDSPDRLVCAVCGRETRATGGIWRA